MGFGIIDQASVMFPSGRGIGFNDELSHIHF